MSAVGAGSAEAAPVDTDLKTYIPITEKASPSGVATLDANAKILPAQLPDLSATIAQQVLPVAEAAFQVDEATRKLLEHGTLLDPCADPTPWSRHRSNGMTVTAGAAVDPEVGRYLRFTTGTVNDARLFRSLQMDLSNAFVSFWLRFNDSNITSFHNEFGTRLTDLNQGVLVGGHNMNPGQLVPGRWNRITVDIARGYRYGRAPYADDANVRDFGFAVATNGSAATFDVAQIRVHDRGNLGGRVIFQFDDAHLDTYTTAFPILAQHNFVGSIPVEVDRVGGANQQPDRMTIAQLQEVYDAGWEIPGHHSQQIPRMTDAQAHVEFQKMKALNANNGWKRGANFFIWPGGIWDPAKEAIALQYFTHLRRVASMQTATTPWVTNKYAIPLAYLTSATNWNTAKAGLDEIKATNSTRLFVFHKIVQSGATAESINLGDFQNFVAHAASLGLKSTTLDEMYGRGQ